jgi:hypothetical protein
MQYLLLIYDNEAKLNALPPAQLVDIYAEYGGLTQSLKNSGHFLAGRQLHPVTQATTVRVKDGKQTVTDGPFAETKEQLGGFYMVEAADLDEAVAIAARIPSARTGSIEVRPLVERKDQN